MNLPPVKKLGFAKRAIIASLLIFSLLFSPLAIPKAQAWDGIIAEIFGSALREIIDSIKGIVVAMLKTLGATLINQMVEKMIGGGSKPLFITDWKQFMVNDPKKKSQVQLNDFLSTFTRGRGSSQAYETAPGSEGIGENAFNKGVGTYSNYATRVNENIKSTVGDSAGPKMTYEGNPANALDSGSFKEDSELRSGFNSTMAAQNEAEAQLDEFFKAEQQIAFAQATAGGGYLPVTQDGMTVLPGKTVGDTVANQQAASTQILTSATRPAEVIAALATKLISSILSKGLGQVQAKIKKEVGGVQVRAQTQVKTQVNTSGPGALYNRH